MKRRGKHPEKALTAVRIRNLSEPGRYADGNGLYLSVSPSGSKRWLLRTIVNGRRRDIGLGSARLVPLADARELAREYRRIARDGSDPIAMRRKARKVIPTFEEAARIVHREHSAAWKNPKHVAQWINTLRDFAFPVIGSRRIDDIDTADIIHVLSPIWLDKPETARRVMQRMGTVFDWARATGIRESDNPVSAASSGLPRQPDRRSNHAALPFAEMPGFMKELHASGSSELTLLAFELLILTAGRTSEVLEANRQEFDLKAGMWTIPAERMKAGKEHRVPLTRRAVKIVRRAMELGGTSSYLFPGASPDKPLSNMTLLMILRRMEKPFTVHGFRSTFRDWASEKTSFPREVCEMALAHTIKNKAEAAYRRGDLFEKRRELMEAWEGYISVFNQAGKRNT